MTEFAAPPDAVVTLSEVVRHYLHTLDESISKLSNAHEGLLANLPLWILSRRHIRIGYTPDASSVLIVMAPDPALEADSISSTQLDSQKDMDNLIGLTKFDVSLASIRGFELMDISRISITPTDPLLPPALDSQNRILIGKLPLVLTHLTGPSPQRDAVEFWNRAKHPSMKASSFVAGVRSTFERFEHIIRRKTFLERRVHRYLRDHGQLLLPAFRRLLFEHPLSQAGKTLKADFILERSSIEPALLIELESPVYRIFRKNGDLTAEATHARGQIASWVAAIDSEPNINASEELRFLVGPKERLVVMGRGKEQSERILLTRFQDTRFLTYDLLVVEARNRWNDILEQQYRTVGHPPLRPL